jgi:next-to-BRCA1 protein 1
LLTIIISQLRYLLAIPPTSEAIFERYSDSAAAFIVLDSSNASVYKQLYRAAKAKLKLRLKVTIKDKEPVTPKPATVEDEDPSPVSPLDEQPTYRSEPQATSLTAVPETQSYTSVAEMQRGFERLLVNPLSGGHPVVPFSSGPSPFTSSHPVTQSFSFRHNDAGDAPTTAKSCSSATASLHRDSSDVSPGFQACSVIDRQAPASVEIPVTRGTLARDKWFAELAGVSQERQNALRNKTAAPAPTPKMYSVYSVYCNNCTDAIADEHYHCSTCDDGDFDLCPSCVEDGVLCGGEGHWMIKRYVKNGKVIASTTETIEPKAFSASKTTLVEEAKINVATRTCNSCIQGK